MAKVIAALKALNVDLRVVPDLDVLNDEEIFKGILEASGIDWTFIQSDYKIIVSQVQSGSREKINRVSAKTAINTILDKSTDANLSSAEIKEIQETIKTASRWENIKKMGISAIPAGDATAAFGRLDTTVKAGGIHLVPVGELECFIKEVGNHGPTWVNNVLEKYPDLDDVVYSKITEFITELSL